MGIHIILKTLVKISQPKEGKKNGLPAIKLATMGQYLSEKVGEKRYLDMKRCGLITSNQKAKIEAKSGKS